MVQRDQEESVSVPAAALPRAVPRGAAQPGSADGGLLQRHWNRLRCDAVLPGEALLLSKQP